MNNTSLIVKELKSVNQDFEWYPTTRRMVELIQKDLLNYFDDQSYDYDLKETVVNQKSIKVLDCGAGDGRVAKELSAGGTAYAIEKSKALIDLMPNDVFIIGTDFYGSTLIDKRVDVIFCNPPYSEYDVWAKRLILEANAYMLYLVIPERWTRNTMIIQALKSRDADYIVLGSDCFYDGERIARAKVDIVAVKFFCGSSPGKYRDKLKVDPFDTWFESNFQTSAKKYKDYCPNNTCPETLKGKLHNKLTTGNGIVPALVDLYNLEIEHLQGIFTSICKLDTDVLSEIGVDTTKIKESLRQRITGLKNKYWKELFNNYDNIAKRLTHSNRKAMLGKLTEHTNIDFTESNIYAVSIWVIKNANAYFDSQLIDLVDRMIDQANVTLYKSNKRLFTDQDWRSGYGCKTRPENLIHFGLELRIVLEGYTAICCSERAYSWDYTNGLHEDRHKFLDDLKVVANNLGFITSQAEDSRTGEEWESNKPRDFMYTPIGSNIQQVLMSVKCFKNGNMHIKFGKDFILSLNIEFGRLKGWLHNHNQASDELNIPVSEAAKRFKANYRLSHGTGLVQIGFNKGVVAP